MEPDEWVGTKGFWVDDNEYCEVVDVIDVNAGVYEFKSLEHVSYTDHPYWIGFIDDFSQDC